MIKRRSNPQPVNRYQKRLRLAFVLVFLMLAGLIVAYGLDRYTQHVQHQQDVARQSSRGVVNQVSLYLNNSKRHVDLFTAQKHKLLQAMAENPENAALYDTFLDDLKQFFPDSVSFVITRPDGTPLIDDFENPVGVIFQNDAKNFIQHNFTRDIYVHPQADAYHVDVMSPWKEDDGTLHVLLVALSLQPLVDILRSNQLPGFEQYLVRTDENNLVELSTRGNRASENTFRNLPPGSEARTVAALDIPDTRWTLYTLASDQLGSEIAVRSIWQSTALILLIAIVLIIAYRMISAEIKARIQAEDDLKDYQKHLEEIVAERTAELEHSNRELEAFSYSVSHDLRSPLRAIDGFSLLLHEDYHDKLGDDANNYINRIRTASQRMAALIDDLLRLARVSRQPLQYRPLDLSEIARHLAGELKQRHPDRSLEFDIEPGLQLDADHTLIRIILSNLLENAVKYTRDCETARIRLFSRQQDDECIVCIEDNGVGFDEAYKDKLFKPFNRLHRADEYDGNGIGLANVARAVNRHGGRIWATSKGQGACFCFTLPPHHYPPGQV